MKLIIRSRILPSSIFFSFILTALTPTFTNSSPAPAPPPAPTQSQAAVAKATDLFEYPTGNAKGSCDGKNVDLGNLISEASKMAQAAITAINNLQSQSMVSLASQTVLNSRMAAFIMFDVKYTGLRSYFSLSKSESAKLDPVKENFARLITLLSGNSRLVQNKAVLACDDNFFTWATKKEDLDSDLRGTPEGQKRPAEIPRGDPGVYFSEFNGRGLVVADEGRKNPDGSPGASLCTGTLDAETWASSRYMLLCPPLFRRVPNLAGFAADQSKVAPGTPISTFWSSAGSFLHEMLHMLHTDAADGKRIGDLKYTEDGKEFAAYEWYGAASLAQEKSTDAPLNADNYHYFAIASYLGDINFGENGKSQ